MAKLPYILLLFSEKLALHHLASFDPDLNMDTKETLFFVLRVVMDLAQDLLGHVQIKRKGQPLPQTAEEIQVGDSRWWQTWDNTYHALEAGLVTWMLWHLHCCFCMQRERGLHRLEAVQGLGRIFLTAWRNVLCGGYCILRNEATRIV